VPYASAGKRHRARFNREADLASTLWHPHIVSVHDRGEHDGQLWISMDSSMDPGVALSVSARNSRPDADGSKL
jgi:serine/threonine protein kinase